MFLIFNIDQVYFHSYYSNKWRQA